MAATGRYGPAMAASVRRDGAWWSRMIATNCGIQMPVSIPQWDILLDGRSVFLGWHGPLINETASVTFSKIPSPK
jgi:hypothetical protein